MQWILNSDREFVLTSTSSKAGNERKIWSVNMMQVFMKKDWSNIIEGIPIKHLNQDHKVSIDHETIINKEGISTANHGCNNETNGSHQDNQQPEVRIGIRIQRRIN